MRTSVLFGVKNFGFFEIYDVSVRTRGGGRGGEPVRTFYGQRGGFFAILCGRLLWTAPKVPRPGDSEVTFSVFESSLMLKEYEECTLFVIRGVIVQ